MTSRLRTMIGLYVLLIVGIAIYMVVNFGSKQSDAMFTADGTLTQVTEISGIVTAINGGCAVDGTCSITLDRSKTIITGCGLQADNTTCAIYDQSDLKTGDTVKATVRQTNGNNYDLECQKCTITKTN